MNDERKTKAQLIAELNKARQRVMELEAAEAARQQQDAARQQQDAARQQQDAARQQQDAARQQLEAERRRLHAALQVSETRYRRLFETAQDGILLLDAATGQITDVNPFLEKLLGYSHVELVGQHLWEIGPFKDVAESKLAFEQLQTNEYIRYEDLPLEARAGQRIEVEFVSNVYLVNGVKVIQCQVRDITARKQLETEIQDARRYAENIVETVREPLVVLNSDLKIFTANRSFYDTFKVSPEETIGNFIYDLGNRQWDIPKLRVLFEEILPRDSVFNDYEVEHDFLNIGQKIILLNARQIFRENIGSHIILLAMEDITERKRAGDALRELNATLEQRVAERTAALRSSESRYRTLAEALHDMIFVIGRDFKVEYVNSFAARSFRRTPEEIIGHTIEEIFPAPVAAQQRLGLTQVFEQGEAHVSESRTVFPTGEMWLSTWLVPIRDEAGNIQAVLGDSRDITASKQAEQEIRSLARFPTENPNPVLRVGADGVLLYANEASEAILQDWACTVGERVPAFWQTAITAAFADQSNQHQDVQVAGRVWTFFMTPVVEAGYLNLYGSDITDRQRAEAQREAAFAALRQSEAQLRAILDATPFPIALVDVQDNNISFWSRSALALFGHTAPTTAEWYQLAYPDPDYRREVLAWWGPALEVAQRSGQTVNMGEYRVTCCDGSVRLCELYATFLVNRLVVTFNDITARKQAEEEVHQLNAELEQRVLTRTAQLEAANKELEAFSYSVSHDLRAPLRAMDGFSRILQEDYGPQLESEAQRYLNIVRDNARQMGRLIDDLLTFSRLSRKALNKQRVEMNQLARQALDEVRREYPTRSVELISSDLPPCEADPALLKQVWVNLLSNAFKFTGKREEARIEIGGQWDQGQPVYFVRDNGAGFDMQYADKLFGVFQRLHRAEEYEGTGVGLAIVKRVIDRHGGRVWAESEVDRGATFYFTLGE